MKSTTKTWPIQALISEIIRDEAVKLLKESLGEKMYMIHDDIIVEIPIAKEKQCHLT